MNRPYPPESMIGIADAMFVPAPEVWEWIKTIFLSPESKLFNPDHRHLAGFKFSDIAVLWANGGFKKQGRVVVGQAERIMINASGWKKERQEVQFIDWFGTVPEYLITLDAKFCSECDDTSFCALIEHELYHIAHKRDRFGFLSYNRETGKPNLEIKGHDVEEFTGVVRRYGASEDVQKMVEAASQKPQVAKADIHHACGTCYLRVV